MMSFSNVDSYVFCSGAEMTLEISAMQQVPRK